MKTFGNVVWLVLAGVWLAAGYIVAGTVACVSIIAIPFGVQAFKLAGYVLWPFGREVVATLDQRPTLSAVGNVVWFLLGGVWLALAHLVTALLLALTIVGIPLAVANLKMVPLALAPFGKQVVPKV